MLRLVLTVTFVLSGALLAGVGVPLMLRRVPPNGWYGVRIPATLADERTWYEVNARSGRDLVVLGSVQLLAALLLPLVAPRLRIEWIALGLTALLLVGALMLTVRAVRHAGALQRARRSAGVALAALLLPLAPFRAVGAQREPASIPAAVARALLVTYEREADDARLFVGTPPDSQLRALLLAGSEPLGGVLRRAGGTLVLTAAGGHQAYAAALEGAGWRPGDATLPRGGFAIGSPFAGRLLCRGALRALVAASGDGGPVVITLSRTAPREACRLFPDGPPNDGAALPELAPPPGVLAGTGGGGGSDDEQYAYTRLRTAVAPPELVAHYAAQLARAGWTLGAPLADDAGIAMRRIERRDPAGRQWWGALVVTALGEERDVRLLLSRAR